MSESSKINKVAPLQQTRTIFIVIFVILTLGYIGGYFILPGMVKSAYRDGNCEAVLSQHDIYSSVYPSAITNESNADLVRECAIYTLAVTNEDAELWRDSYYAFSVYRESYPQGLFTDEVCEHSAVVLMGLVNEDVGQGNYAKADDGLNFILENYSDTPIAADAKKIKTDLRMELGINMRETGDFAIAQQIFIEINEKAREANQAEEIRLSK